MSQKQPNSDNSNNNRSIRSNSVSEGKTFSPAPQKTLKKRLTTTKTTRSDTTADTMTLIDENNKQSISNQPAFTSSAKALTLLSRQENKDGTVLYSTPKELKPRHYWIRALRRLSLAFLFLYFFAQVTLNPYTFRLLRSTLEHYFPETYTDTVVFFNVCPLLNTSLDLNTKIPAALQEYLTRLQLTWLLSVVCMLYLGFSTVIMPWVGQVPFWGTCVFAAIAVICSKLYNQSVVWESMKIAPEGITLSHVRLGGKKIERFIPRESLASYAISEGFTKCRVLFYLFFLIKDTNEIVVPFQDLLPPLNDLVIILREVEKTYAKYATTDVAVSTL